MTDLEEKLEGEISTHEAAIVELKTMLAEYRGTDTDPPEMPLTDFLAKRTEVRWLVNGLIARGALGFLVGDGHIGKSALAVQLMLSISAARPIFGWAVPTPGKCLYVFAEGARELVRARIETAAASMKCAVPPNSWVQSESFRDFNIKTGGIARLIGRTRPDFVCLDTLERIWDGDENKSKEWKHDVLGPLTRLQHEYGCAVMILHHSGKDSEFRKGWQKGRGTAAMFDDSDFWLQIEGELNAPERVLHLHKNKWGISGIEVPMTFDKAAAMMRWDAAIQSVESTAIVFETAKGFKTYPQLEVFEEEGEEL